MRNAAQKDVIQSDARTKSGQSSDVLTLPGSSARFLFAVTSVSGTTPTLDIKIEGKTRRGGYVTLASFRQATGVTSESIDLARLPPYYRISWTIGGTNPSFTFEIDSVTDTQ